MEDVAPDLVRADGNVMVVSSISISDQHNRRGVRRSAATI
jgi:hypothetical protein